MKHSISDLSELIARQPTFAVSPHALKWLHGSAVFAAVLAAAGAVRSVSAEIEGMLVPGAQAFSVYYRGDWLNIARSLLLCTATVTTAIWSITRREAANRAVMNDSPAFAALRERISNQQPVPGDPDAWPPEPSLPPDSEDLLGGFALPQPEPMALLRSRLNHGIRTTLIITAMAIIGAVSACVHALPILDFPDFLMAPLVAICLAAAVAVYTAVIYMRFLYQTFQFKVRRNELLGQISSGSYPSSR
jgi:hypothetical protein